MATAQDLLALDFARFDDLIAAHARERPDDEAIADEDGRLTWAELESAVDRIAARLQATGLAPNQAVAIVGAPSVAYALIFIAALRAGGCAAPLTATATPEALAAMIADSGARHLFADADIAVDADVERIDLARLNDWMACRGTTPERRAPAPGDPFNIIYSSGTTGAPKGIVQSHAMRWQHIIGAKAFGYDEHASTLLSTPLYSNTTLVSFIPSLAFGARVVTMRKFEARRFLELSEAERITHAMLVPVQYKRLMERADFGDFDLSAYRCKFATSAPFAAALKADVIARWPGELVEFYGMTEGGGSFVLLASRYPDKLHSVGFAARGTDARVIDADGREMPTGQKGEVVGRSASMMSGYRNRPDATDAASWFDAEGRRYLRTGDIGWLDEDGFLTLTGRAKDMIISGGFNIYPIDLEAALLAEEAVAEAAVVGAPSEDWGETPVGFVTLAEGARADGEALRAAANARLGKTQRLSAVHVIDAMPRSEIGKILKRELRARL